MPQRVISFIIKHHDDYEETQIIHVPTKNRGTSCGRNIIILCDLEHFREILAGKQRDTSDFVAGKDEKIVFTTKGSSRVENAEVNGKEMAKLLSVVNHQCVMCYKLHVTTGESLDDTSSYAISTSVVEFFRAFTPGQS